MGVGNAVYYSKVWGDQLEGRFEIDATPWRLG
jgi:hypothetical protein